MTGYTGSRDEPSGFYLLDPIYGTIYQSTKVFLNSWSVLGRSGVIVK
jgi:hypothetical protein